MQRRNIPFRGVRPGTTKKVVHRSFPTRTFRLRSNVKDLNFPLAGGRNSLAHGLVLSRVK